MAPENLCIALRYVCHSSALQDDAFARADLRAQTAIGHIVVLPWADIRYLPRIWIIPLGLIPQEGRYSWIIYDYTRRRINTAFLRQAPAEVMQFFQMLSRLLHTIFNANPWGGPVFMSKIDIADAYIRVWIYPEDLPQLAFVAPT